MKHLLILTALLLSSAAHADTTTYDVAGMHCGSCAKSIQAQVCKMDGIEKCDVTVGKIVISSKKGVVLSQDQIQAAVSKAGDYKITGAHKDK
ncbi:heavy-metal-associated domain-containing protein [Bdellovibrio sp. HCB2-146]|uniref:heavy-metal-associated domain-containing protein n=1 Tax=Bdellovibrio sp. HCB2-146 TaxID=3394362 RepID=UPI0039BCE42D